MRVGVAVGVGAAGARLEDVEGAAEEQGELQGRAQGGAGARRCVVRREDGYLEGVVLFSRYKYESDVSDDRKGKESSRSPLLGTLLIREEERKRDVMHLHSAL